MRAPKDIRLGSAGGWFEAAASGSTPGAAAAEMGAAGPEGAGTEGTAARHGAVGAGVTAETNPVLEAMPAEGAGTIVTTTPRASPSRTLRTSPFAPVRPPATD